MKIKSLLAIIVILLASHGSPSPACPPEFQMPGICDEVRVELAQFTNYWTEWGGDPKKVASTSSRYTAPDGRWFSDGFTFFGSRSGYEKAVRHLIAHRQPDILSLTPLADKYGKQTGRRLVLVTRNQGEITLVQIFLMSDQTIRGFAAPSLQLALASEKAETVCRVGAEKRADNR